MSFLWNAEEAVKAAPETVTMHPPAAVPSGRSTRPASPNALPSSGLDEFSAAEVIDSFDCRMTVGGPDNDIAAVVLPAESGTRFAVLDSGGQVFGDTLPFVPNHRRLGKRSDGTVLAGFGDLRLNSKVFRGAETPEPARIYQDGYIAYETDKAWDFGIARDGTSFFVHEPLPGGASRLVVRDLDAGTEDHIHFGETLTPTNAYQGDYRVAYAFGAREIMVEPVHADFMGLGSYRFHAVQANTVREIRLGADDNRQHVPPPTSRIQLEQTNNALFASSEAGYFARRMERGDLTTGEPWRITKRRFHFRDGEGIATVAWTRELRLRGFNGRMTLSHNGKWLSLGAWNLRVLDTETSETIFAFPQADKAAQRARLAGVADESGTMADVGSIRGERFLGDQLLLFRRFGDSATCGALSSPGHRACLANLRRRGVFREVVDVFDMNTVAIDSPPDYRLDVGADMPCGAGDFPLRGLQVHNGRLTFLTTRR